MQHTHTQNPFRFWFISSMRTLAAVKISFGLVTKLKIFFLSFHTQLSKELEVLAVVLLSFVS